MSRLESHPVAWSLVTSVMSDPRIVQLSRAACADTFHAESIGADVHSGSVELMLKREGRFERPG